MEVKTERVDDIPLIKAEFAKSDLTNLLESYFPDHGNWKGISGGKVTVGFLIYILSCSDHRISHVETWAAQRLTTLKYCLNSPDLTCKDFTDDKLGSLLDRFSDDEKWAAFEKAHNQRLINVYNLAVHSEAIRLDAMITQSHRTAEGDFQFGHSKQHRSDLPQLKTMVATLDPLAMPLFSVTVSGNTSDDVLYLPVIKELMVSLTLFHQLFVGDAKMGSLETRSFLQLNNQYYLVPLSKKQCTPAQLAEYLAKKPVRLTQITTKDKDDKVILKAQAFEVTEQIEVPENGICWKERRIIVYSPAYAKRQRISFETRLAKAQDELNLLLDAKQGRKKLTTKAQVLASVTQILTKHKVNDFLEVAIDEQIETKTVRKYKDRPEEIRQISHFELDITINETAKAEHLQNLGWRAYACNAPIERLNTTQVVECYRDEYKIEHKFDELLNKITALMPVYLGIPARIKGLIRLLLLVLKYVSLIQYQVRAELKTTKQTVKELYPGNPGRATDKPTTNMILRAFNHIHLTVVSVENKIHVNVSDLKPIQLKILELLKIPPEIYTGMNELFFSHSDFSET